MRSWLLRLAAVTLGLILALGLAELGARLLWSPEPAVVLEHRPDNPNYALTRDVGGDLSYEFIPSSAQYDLQINTHGFRDLERVLAKPPGLKRVLCLGDSITMGGSLRDYVPLLQTWPLVLETILDDPDGQRVEAWNTGIVGYNLVQYAALLEQRVEAIAPDAIVIGLCLNDMSTRQVVHREDSGFTVEWYDRSFPVVLDLGESSNRWLLDRSRFWQLLNLGLAAALDHDGPRIDLDFRACQEALIRLLKVGQRRGIPVVALLFPELGADAVSNEDSNLMHRRLLNATWQAKLDVVDLTTTYRPHGGLALRQHPDDPVHPNAHGHCLAARAAYERLLRIGPGWIPRGRLADAPPCAAERADN